MYTYIDDVLVDASINENPIFANRITDKPVEEGGSIADHIENEPTLLQLECTVTGEEGASADEKYERLQEIAQEKEVIEVVGALQVYENMVIEELAPDKDADIGNGFRADITLKQIRVVEPEVIIFGIDPVTGEQVQDETEELEQRDPEESDVDSDVPTSILWELFNMGGDEE